MLAPVKAASAPAPGESPSLAGAQAKVKVCGLTSLGDAQLAADLGAWALGMIFYDASPRRCSTGEAQRIVAALRRSGVELCGVFVNETLENVLRASEDLGLTMVQLHGDEGPVFCGEVARRTGAKVIRAVQVAGPGDVRDVERYHVDYHLLDARPRGGPASGLRGGTGQSFDWDLLAARRSRVPLILSGGIGPDNAAQAIERVRPYAIDSASATESAPGHKDPGKLAALFAAVARTDHAPAAHASAAHEPAQSEPAGPRPGSGAPAGPTSGGRAA